MRAPATLAPAILAPAILARRCACGLALLLAGLGVGLPQTVTASPAPRHARGPSPQSALQVDAIAGFGIFPFDGGAGLWARYAGTAWARPKIEGSIQVGVYGIHRLQRLNGDPWASRPYEVDGLSQRGQAWLTVGHVFRLLPSHRLELGIHGGAGAAWMRARATIHAPELEWTREASQRADSPSAGVLLDVGGWLTRSLRLGLLVNYSVPFSTAIAQYGWIGATLGVRLPARTR